jgi:hypothetical protein
MRANLCNPWSVRVRLGDYWARSSDPPHFWSRSFGVRLRPNNAGVSVWACGYNLSFPMIFRCSEETPFLHVKLTYHFNLNSEVC